MPDYLTPRQAMDRLGVCDKTLRSLAVQGTIKRVNVSAGPKQARWRYIIDLEPEPDDLAWLELKRRHGL